MRIRLTEGDIRRMVNETIKRILKESMFDEDLKLSEPTEGAEPVVLYIGRFQPFHKGHEAAIEFGYKQSGGKRVLVFVSKGDPNPKKNKPIYGEAQDEMIERIKNAYSKMVADIIYPATYIDEKDGKEKGIGAKLDFMTSVARSKGFEPVGWVTGEEHIAKYVEDPKKKNSCYDRMAREYGDALKLTKPESEGGWDDFMHVLPKKPNAEQSAATDIPSISGTNVRKAIAEGDYETFKQLVPDVIKDEEMFSKFYNLITGNDWVKKPTNEPLQVSINENTLKLSYEDIKKIAKSFIKEG